MTWSNKKIFFIIFSLFVLPLFASDITLNTSIDKTKGYIGDNFLYTILIRHPKSYTIFTPSLGENLGSFQIKEFRQNQKKINNNMIEKKFEFTLSAYITGEFDIPAFQIYYKDNENHTNFLRTDDIHIAILKMTSTQMTNMDIKDLKSQLKIDDKFLWIKILIIVLLFGIGIYLFWLKDKKKLEVVENFIKPKPELLDYEEALENLQKISNSSLLKEKKIKEFYSQINEVIRYYLFRKYKIITLESTSYEILQELNKVFLPKDILRLIEKFLEQSDMVKFAKYNPTKNEIDAFLQFAFDIVNLTIDKHQDEEES